MTQETVVEQPMKSTAILPFEVIAVPQYDYSQLVNSTHYNLTDPINIKIKIRNKEETCETYGTVTAPKLVSANNGKKVRLVSSDQTIMSFDLFVEPDTSKKYQKKSHKNFFHFFKPGGCLRIQNDNDDKSSYLPSAINDVGSIEETNIISEKIVLKKNFPRITSNERTEKQSKAFMGKCKPGGCLDPPFNDDKHPYEPASKLSCTNLKYSDDGKKSLSPEIKSFKTDSDVKIQIKEKTENIVKQQLEDKFNESDYENSLITYPTSSSSDDFRMNKENHNMKLKSRISSENKARMSINEFSEIFFMPPKKEKTKRIEDNFTEKASTIEDKDIDIKKSNYSLLKQEQLESLAIVIDSKILNNNNVGKSKLFIESSYLVSEINSHDNDIQSIQENAKCVDSIETIKNLNANLYNINSNNNTFFNAHSQDLLNINKAMVFPLENIVSYSQNGAPCNKSPTNTEIQVKETKEPDNTTEKFKETNKNESRVTDDLDDIRSSLRNIIHKTTSNTAAIPANKTKELSYSFSKSIETFVEEQKILPNVKEFQESFEKNLEDITNTAEIKATLIKSKDRGNLHTNNIINNDDVQAKESQYLQKNPESLLISPVDITSVNEVKNVLKDEVDDDNLIIDKNTYDTFHPAEESSLALTLSDQNIKNIKNIFPDDYQMAISSDKIPGVFTGDKLNLMDISSNQVKDYYTQEHVDENNLTSNNTIIRSRNESVEISATELQRQASEVNLIRKQMSSVFLIRDETGEKHLNSIHEEKKDSTLEKIKHLSSSESVSNALDSNRNRNDRSENVDRSYESEISKIIDKLRPLEDQPLKIKVESSSNKVNGHINNKHQPESNVTNSDNEDYAKTIDLMNMEQLQYNSLKLSQPDGRKQEEADTENITKPCHEVFHASPYSSIAIDFGFRYSVDNDHKLTIHTVDTSTPLKKRIGDNISVIKSMIRANGDEIRIPINFNTDLALEIKNARTMNEVETPQMQYIIERPSENKIEKDGLLQETLYSVYKNLIPLNMILQNLKEEASTLSRQQTSMQEILENMEKKPMRLIHTNAFCDCRKK
ncbi:putative uncharacterized protein DDB_G0282133 [Nymphalis io]|uniref:putative uncharacterized protein DDB_G0282133 n=1 Tax=Inachis io TaxID=171585 RepID=UPI0021692635|nr:putative uncharacterized protein DDB_G0282133 [Nymphalis io]